MRDAAKARKRTHRTRRENEKRKHKATEGIGWRDKRPAHRNGLPTPFTGMAMSAVALDMQMRRS